MRVLELSAPETLTLTQRDVPTPGPGQVLVRMTCVGVCGSDTHYLTHGRIGSYAVDYPMVLGHEGAGVVEAVGEGVDASRIGERVSIEPGVPCRTCAQCLAGAYNLCPDMVFHATPPYDGSLAECIVHDAAFAHPLPDGVSDEAAAMVEPLSVGLWACRKADVTLGDRVLITGCGPIGLMCLLAARARGARDITVVDLNPERLERARALGARVVDSRHERFDEREYDVCSSAPGSPQSRSPGCGPWREALAPCSSGWAATLSNCPCLRCRSVRSAPPGCSATRTHGRRRSRCSRAASSRSTIS